MKNMLVRLKRWMALGYAMVLLIMVVIFFFNYGGRWMRLIAETLPIKGN
jgi:hypothetical protein